MNKKTVQFILFLILYIGASNVPVFSQTQDKEPNILLYVHSLKPVEEIDLKESLNESISAKMGKEGFNVIKIENKTPLTELFDTAEWMGAFFIVEVLYETTSSSPYFHINCYAVWDGSILYSFSSPNGLDQSLDLNLEDSLNEMIPIIRDNLYIVEQIILTAELEEEAIKEAEEIITEPVTGSGNDLGGEIREEIVLDDPYDPFGIEAGLAPFIATGESTKYFTLGFDISLFGGYYLEKPFGYLILGGTASIDLFEAKGILVSSDNILISTGPEIRAELNFNGKFNMFFRGSLGGTIYLINANDGGYEALTVPYLSIGFGFNYYLMNNIAFVFITNYTVHMEQSVPISGFLPTCGVNIRF